MEQIGSQYLDSAIEMFEISSFFPLRLFSRLNAQDPIPFPRSSGRDKSTCFVEAKQP
jgi:hypothetical protein